MQQPVAQVSPTAIDRAVPTEPFAAQPKLRSYPELLEELKERIRSAQVRSVLAINRELILTYWHIGQRILLAQQQEGWGAKVIDRLATDLTAAFPTIGGFSTRNLKYMRALAEAYPHAEFVQQVVAQIPWGHNVRLLDAVKDPVQREWYIRQTIANGWSRAVLVHQIESDLFARQGQAITNFDRTLPAESDLVRQLIKDPYHFDFLTLGPDVQERQLEQSLLDHIRQFLLELGTGFAFIASQQHLEVSGQDYYLDLFFYHIHLRRFIVIDLKVDDFKPEFAGKMNFYLSAVDEQFRGPQDGPTIGLLLCKTRNRTIVEYALRDTAKPIGVAEYRVGRQLPEDVRRELPSPETLAAELEKTAGRGRA